MKIQKKIRVIQKMSSKEDFVDRDELNKEVDKIDDLEGLDKEQLKGKAIKEFNIDKQELDNAIEAEAIFSKETKDAIANIEYFAEKLENTLRGKILEKKGKDEEVYKQKGKALAGETFISQVTSIIKTFANKPMLISGKQDKEFFMQFEDAFYTISDMVLERKHNINVLAVRSILKEVKDTFWNLGDIIMRTGRNMETYFGQLNKMDEDVQKKAKSSIGDF